MKKNGGWNVRRHPTNGPVYNTMESTDRKTFFALKTAFMCFLAVASAGAVALRLYVISTDKLSTLSAVLTIVIAVCAGVFAFLLRKKAGDGIRTGSPLTAFAYAVAGFMAVTMIVCSFVIKRQPDKNSFIFILSLVFAVLASFYFLLSAASSSFCRKAGPFALFSLSAPLYFAFRALNDYINIGTMPFKNSGVYHLLGVIFTMLFFLLESRRLVSGGGTFLYLLTGGTAFLLLCSYDIPVLVNYVRGIASEGYSAVQSMFSLSVIIYIAVRIVLLPAPDEPAPASGQPEQ